MAPPADNTRARLGDLWPLLAPYPGRLEFALRLAVVCALTTLVVEIYQTPEAALTIYMAFFVIKPDRVTSIIMSVAMTILMTIVIGMVTLITIRVIDHVVWRVVIMALLSFGLLFAASASKLKPIAGIVALVAAYALDLLGTTHGGEITTRALLYAWLFVGIPASVCIVVNLAMGPAPRQLAERALAERLAKAAAALRAPGPRTRREIVEYLREGPGDIPQWLKRAGVEKTSPPRDIAALRQAAAATSIILSMVEFITRPPQPLLPHPVQQRMAALLDEMADILRSGRYPVDIVIERDTAEPPLTPIQARAFEELSDAVTHFADPPSVADVSRPAKPGGFFHRDAFSNPVHVQYALKTTAAAMLCYFVYSMLDWPGIHTCLITCYIVSLDSTAETFEKQTLRFFGCMLGAAIGLLAIVFVMPSVQSIGALMALVFVAAASSGWVAAGSARISYVGFQIAFAFFLSVVQGASPAFDMSIARDRLIGILLGNLAVALIFTTVRPISLAARIDPAVAELLRRLSMLATTASRAARWALASEAQKLLGAIEQNLELLRYEPSTIRPASSWLSRRRQVVRSIGALQAPLLIEADENRAVIGERLERLSLDFDGGEEKSGAIAAPAAAARANGSVEAGLAALESIAATRRGTGQ